MLLSALFTIFLCRLYGCISKQMLPCVCSVIDYSMVPNYRWHKNVPRTRALKAIAECVTDVLTTFWRLLWSFTEQTHSNIISVFFLNNNWKKNYYRLSLSISASFTITRNPAFAHFDKHEKKSSDVSIVYIKKQYHGFYAGQRNVIGPGKSRHCQTWLEDRFSALIENESTCLFRVPCRGSMSR